ncbi:MAG: bifunctional UDP-3-O-[3-hydroxymyristoyl] N-acetylglucosamine deacetylase/3-hydroxyacyl-ACP dehydratase [Bacteroidetes bacterium]|nr:bifunctional UDP-3-O-[3-hydroxymyristoyl] N-acetylglucosamine deacetylase/3-hydroxyacyl-ACP dehydratase [Bacteroidota bacterium]MDA1225923.1 bifunctional UDP-3-O-[3-hydroxymyristoyl] N-acetylglucosamine deacetylase/3-hydroxyacyl-ACP dehydratase [Bacteroidota bacterium]
MIRRTVPQKTISRETKLSGVGLHTGKSVNIIFKPAPVNTGLVFVREDIDGDNQINAHVKFISNTDRGTNLDNGSFRIHTSEHVLAAITGLEIDNCFICLDGPEVPIMDGSSKFFINALEEAKIIEQNVLREEFFPSEIISYECKDSGSKISIIPDENYKVKTIVDYKTKVLGEQEASINHINEFKEEISSARTFSFLHELETLLENGLIKGGDLNNAIVYVDKPLADSNMDILKKAFNKDSISVSANGILNNLDLHYPNEAARHKLLDVIGDLALIGMKIRGKVIAEKPGHSINAKFADKVSQVIKSDKKNTLPKIDFQRKPLMDSDQIMNVIPHRPPFLLIDEVLELSESHVIGLRKVQENESWVEGHFPGSPVMPGVLQVEFMAQAGGVLVLSTVPDPENYLTFFMKMDKCKFKNPVVPGDTLICKLELISPIRRGIIHMYGQSFVGDEVKSEGEFMAKIIKKI